MNITDQTQSAIPGFPEIAELDNVDVGDIDSPDQLGVTAGVWSAEPVDPITLPLDLAIVFDDVPDVTVSPGHAAGDHDEVAVDADPLEAENVSRAAGWFRRILNATPALDADTVDVALRLGDLLAASGNPVEALTVYREILEGLTRERLAGADRVAERVGAVISVAGLETGHPSPVVADLASMLPLSAADPAAARQLYRAMVDSAHRDVAEISLLQSGIDSIRHVTDRGLDRTAAAELDSNAMRNGAAAFVRLSDVGPGGDSRDLFDLLISALLDTPLGSFRVVDGYRGRQHRVRFAHHCIVKSPRPDGTHAEHVQAVLDTPLTSRHGTLLRDVMSGLGAFVEDSAVLLEEWKRQEGISERDIVINCPLLLRNRKAPSLSTTDVTATPPLASLVLTSLGWGGAADIGAIVAQDWNWGYATANDAQRLLAFGDWTEDPNGRRRQSDGARSLLRTTNTLLDALPDLPRRVCVLDEPRGAIEALASRSSIGSPEQPIAVVAIVMSERRIRWVAQHMLSYGGSVTPTAQEIDERAAALLALQRQLEQAVADCRSACTPVLVFDMDDHLADGYADQTGNDPVDEDFDCFYTTAQKLRTVLNQLEVDSPAPASTEAR